MSSAKLTTESLALPSVWVDSMNLVIRADIPVAMMRFYTFIPPDKLGGDSGVRDGKMLEVVRCHTSVAHLRDMTKILCKNLDYYPTKAEQPKRTKS